MKKAFFILTAFFLLALAFHAAAQIPRTLSYQGVLTDNAGKPRPDGSYSFTFRFYTSLTGGTAIWSESKSLSVKSGLFSTVLGEQTPFGAAVKFDQQYWLGIQVGSDPELSPRIPLTSVGYSFSSLRADTARVSVASLADTTWRHSGANIYRLNGNVGIGTTSPGAKLDVVGNVDLGDAGTDADYGLYLIRGGGAGRQGQGRVVVRHSEQASYSGSVTIEPYWYNGSIYEYKPNVLVVDATGNVGIGTTTPSEKLDVVGNVGLGDAGIDADFGLYMIRGGGAGRQGQGRVVVRHSEQAPYSGSVTIEPYWYNGSVYEYRRNVLVVDATGNVGIGTTSPRARLDVAGDINLGNAERDADVSLDMVRGGGAGRQGQGRVVVRHSEQAPYSGSITIEPRWYNGSEYEYKRNVLVVDATGNVGIGTSNPQYPLDVNGRTRTSVLEITGGGDLAEPFEISDSQPIPKGALVIIDEENPGQLKLSHQAYDKRVAGVVSGAGGINPGLTLTQEGVLEGGQNVALSGRVYALATAANGPIKPGDLLTTSEIPGHAMKATDHERAYGAVIGKAMSTLEGGEGLVLVLIQPH
jgi:hypothetical protein